MDVKKALYKWRETNKKALAVLIDPDKAHGPAYEKLMQLQPFAQPDIWLVGGSLITEGSLEATIATLRKHTSRPVVLFPGDHSHLTPAADALLLLSLISGRNPEYLIGRHVLAAPRIKQLKLATLSTGYMLVEAGNTTTAAYVSGTQPLPADKPEIAACTALAAEQLGMEIIYADGGSGAKNAVTAATITAIRQMVRLPLLIGGGIRSAAAAKTAWLSGADCIVVGTATEQHPELIEHLAIQRDELNGTPVWV
jgi:putative glycerol-1-phosphate prenyltransferase